MDTKLKNYLDKNKIKYGLEEHRKVYTAFDEAETQQMKPKEVAKTVLVKADSGLALVVVPAAKNVDFGKVKKALKAKKVSMAKESDIAKKLKTKVGLIHPFGQVYKIENVLVDSAVLKQKKIITSAGSYTESVMMNPANFKKAVGEALITGSFNKAK